MSAVNDCSHELVGGPVRPDEDDTASFCNGLVEETD
jgi:hypothetical protein